MSEELSYGARFNRLVTCPEYTELIASRPESTEAFAAHALGFMHGQAEKVMSGACRAFMVRPDATWMAWACRGMHLVCQHYGLLQCTDLRNGEIWGCADEQVRRRLQWVLRYGEKNNAAWHIRRAELCGIQAVDTRYHERSTYGAKCEPEVQ
jgi:hypothetical protein